MTAIGETLDLAQERTRSGGHALELKRRDNIGMLAIGKLGQRLIINPAKAR